MYVEGKRREKSRESRKNLVFESRSILIVKTVNNDHFNYLLSRSVLFSTCRIIELSYFAFFVIFYCAVRAVHNGKG